MVKLLDELQEAGADLELSGFDHDEIDNLMSSLPDIPDVDPPVVEDDFDVDHALSRIDVPETERGDIWKRGPHILMCGNATDPEDVTRLMEGEKTALVVTDPPYNVAVESDSERLAADGQSSILNDDMPADEFAGFLNAVFQSYAGIMLPTAAMYVFHPSSYQREFENAMNAVGIVVRSQCMRMGEEFSFLRLVSVSLAT